jgi:septal ring-binding cell division protein DamX
MAAEAPAFAAQPPPPIGPGAPAEGSISMASADPPLVMMEPEPALTMAPPALDEPPIAPPPPPVEPVVAAPPPPPTAPPGGRRVYDMPPLVPPPPKDEPIRPASATPPTPSELKALDELLNPRLEAPRAALERGESARAGARSDAASRAGTSPRPTAKGGSSRAPMVLGALAVLALAAGAGWFFLMKPRAAAPGARADARPPAPVATTATTMPPPPVVPPDAGTQGAAAAPAPVEQPPVTAAAADARGQLQAGNLAEASRLYAEELRAAGRGAVAIQLFVACSPETIQKAVAAVGTQDLAIFPTRFNGRDCYRMAWGIHPSSQAAVRSLQSLPDYFRQGGASPKVVPAAEILR